METTTCTGHAAYRRSTPARIAGAVAALACAAFAACGGSTSPTVIESAPVDTSTLAGTWKGSVDGGTAPNSYGFSAATTVLRADSTFTTEGENPLYCKLDGVWSVSGVQYTATGRDCTGTVVTSVAPVSPRRLTGTWSATSGRGGTFTMAKQP